MNLTSTATGLVIPVPKSTLNLYQYQHFTIEFLCMMNSNSENTIFRMDDLTIKVVSGGLGFYNFSIQTQVFLLETAIIFGKWYYIAIKQIKINKINCQLQIIWGNSKYSTKPLTCVVLTDFILSKSSITVNTYYQYVRLWKIPRNDADMYTKRFAPIFDSPSNKIFLQYDFRFGYDAVNNVITESSKYNATYNINLATNSNISMTKSLIKLCGKNQLADTNDNCVLRTDLAVLKNDNKYITLDSPENPIIINDFAIDFYYFTTGIDSNNTEKEFLIFGQFTP